MELESTLSNVSGRYFDSYMCLCLGMYIRGTRQIRAKGMLVFTERISDINLRMQYSCYLTEYLKFMESVYLNCIFVRSIAVLGQ